MKKALLIVLTALSAIGMLGEANAADASAGFLGYFASSNEAAMLGYENEEKCAADNGRWIENECFFGAEDSVSVKAGAEGALRVAIETFGLTGAMCEYEGTAVARDERTLVSSRPVQEWNGTAFVEAICEVEVNAQDDGSMSVRNNGKCDTFCGPRASLEIISARRK